MAFWPGRSCTFEAKADNPHLSSNKLDASGKGAWVNASNCPNEADVTVELQAYICTEILFYRSCDWVTVGSNAGSKIPEDRVIARYPCLTKDEASWRTKVTVRVPISRWFDKTDTDTNVKNFNCRVSP